MAACLPVCVRESVGWHLLSLGFAAGVNDLISFRAQVNFITVDNGQVGVGLCVCVCKCMCV